VIFAAIVVSFGCLAGGICLWVGYHVGLEDGWDRARRAYAMRRLAHLECRLRPFVHHRPYDWAREA
jgi:hypothetical protein